jgi:large-conductance mechanosensitive channel
MGILISAAISFVSVALIVFFVVKFAMDTFGNDKKKAVRH